MKSSINYRPEIDGLRAIAVISVILFHSGLKSLEGGFLGVDIFFVISGYLITTIIINDLENHSFNFFDFYTSRARRILPALYFVVLVCIPFAWIWMPPNLMKEFSQSLVSISLISSNVLFWLKSGYFDISSNYKPLLHTWSLSVELQFYLIFPILFYFIWKYFKKNVFQIILILTILILFFCEWLITKDASANFYSLITRMFELLAGSLSALVHCKNSNKSNNFYSIFGLALIFSSIFFYKKSMLVPGINSLPPIIGTILIILYSHKTLAGKFLSYKLFVFIGIISYSAYLWHQPLFVFYRIYALEDPTKIGILILTIVSFIFAFFSWKYVEKPFRKKNFNLRIFFLLFFMINILFLTIGLTGHYKNGFESQTKIKNISYKPKKIFNIDIPIYVFGDSHAAHLMDGFKYFNKNKVYKLTDNGCIPFKNVDRYDYRIKPGLCVHQVNKRLKKISEIKEKAILIFSSMGPVYLENTAFNNKDVDRVTGSDMKLITNKDISDHYKIFEEGMRDTLRKLSKKKNLYIIFTLDVPELGIDFGCQTYLKKKITIFGFSIQDMIKPFDNKKCHIPRNIYDKRVKKYKILVSRVLKDFPDIFFFDPSQHFCDKINCYGYSKIAGYLYSDSDHLSKNGSKYYVEKLFLDLKKVNF